MVWRKRASPAPAFRQPAPYSPIGGQHAILGREGMHSRIAIFQVIETDTHDDYVVCKGYDLDTDADCRYEINTIPVAKPYSLRGTKPYKVGMMLTCGKPRTKFGDNSGKADTTVGQPEDLNEDIVALEDDDGKTIQWMIIDSSTETETWELTEFPVFDTDTKEYKAAAKLVLVESTSTYSKYEADAAVTDTVWFPAFMRESGDDILRCSPGFTTLSRVHCIRSQAGRLVVLDGLPRIIQFELKEDLVPPLGHAAAYLIKEDGTVDTAVTFDVYDAPEGGRSGLGRDTTGSSSGAHGVRGKAIIGSSGNFEIISLGTSTTWLKVKTGFINVDSDVPVEGYGNPCDWDGNGVDTGTTIEFSTPIRDNKATALFTDYIIEVEQQKDGTLLVVSDCFDDPMDTVRLWDSAQDPPDGWSIFTEMAGKFPVGVQTSAASPDIAHALDATGGAIQHLHAAHSVSLADAATGSPSVYKCIIAASSSVTSLSLTHKYATADSADPYCHLPPWLGLYFIKRTS